MDTLEILKLDSQARYQHFLNQSIFNRAVWGLYANGWAVQGSENAQFFFPVWPSKETAKMVGDSWWEGYSPKFIDIKDWIEELLPNYSQKGVKVSISPSEYTRTVVISSELLLKEYRKAIYHIFRK